MRSSQKRTTLTASYKAKARRVKKAEVRRPASENTLSTLYSRLDKTRPGSKESKRLADEIVDAISAS
jgi:hypothetical protein